MTAAVVVLCVVGVWGALNLAWWIDRRMRDKHDGKWP